MIKTLLAATVLLLLCAGALGIGYFLTGKSRLKKGCGTKPNNQDRPSGGCGSGRCGGCS